MLWAFVDNSFFALTAYRWEETRHELLTRHIVCIAFILMAVCLNSIVFLRLLIGAQCGRSLAAIMLATGLWGGWTAVLISIESIAWNGLVYRARSMIPTLKEDVNVLTPNWPNANGYLPHLGAYEAYTTNSAIPSTLYLKEWTSGFEFRKTVGPLINLGDGGQVRFSLSNHLLGWIEYRPSVGETLSHCESYADESRCIELEPHWFLIVRRESAFRPK